MLVRVLTIAAAAVGAAPVICIRRRPGRPAGVVPSPLADELERRGRDAFARWTGAGARPGGDPRSYLLTGGETARPPAPGAAER